MTARSTRTSRRGFLKRTGGAAAAGMLAGMSGPVWAKPIGANDDIRIAVDGDQAEAAFSRTDSFTDRETGEPVAKDVSLTRRLRRDGRSWRLVLDGR